MNNHLIAVCPNCKEPIEALEEIGTREYAQTIYSPRVNDDGSIDGDDYGDKGYYEEKKIGYRCDMCWELIAQYEGDTLVWMNNTVKAP